MALVNNSDLGKLGFRQPGSAYQSPRPQARPVQHAPQYAPRAPLRGFGSAPAPQMAAPQAQRVIAQLIGAVNQLGRNFDILRAENAQLRQEIAALRRGTPLAGYGRHAPVPAPRTVSNAAPSQGGGRVVSMENFRQQQAQQAPQEAEYVGPEEETGDGDEDSEDVL